MCNVLRLYWGGKMYGYGLIANQIKKHIIVSNNGGEAYTFLCTFTYTILNVDNFYVYSPKLKPYFFSLTLVYNNAGQF